MTFDPSTGVISGTPTETVLPGRTFEVSTGDDGKSFPMTLTVLEDTDGDGMPDELPDGYPEDGPLKEDKDDDGDGVTDDAELGGAPASDPKDACNGHGDSATCVEGVCRCDACGGVRPNCREDSDGDGVDDGIDAFPNDACCSTDTDRTVSRTRFPSTATRLDVAAASGGGLGRRRRRHFGPGRGVFCAAV